MRAIHFDCFSGISGDMTLAALLDVGADETIVRRGLDSLGLPLTMRVEQIRKGGFQATQVKFDFPHEHAHRHLHHIEEILEKGALSDAQRTLALRIFRRLGEAEAEVHGIELKKVHFHEVGALDSIADITGVAIALDSLNVEMITCRSVPTGSGTVKCEHGIMPVPAPATAKLLQGVPLANTAIEGELTTPTGAAILATVVQEWTDHPSMTIDKIGCGAGTRDLTEQPNILRVFLGQSEKVSQAEQDRVCMLETNLDDVTPEVIGYCFEQLLQAGALDVYTSSIHMKKNRPGVMMSVIASEEHVQELETILFRETGTFGIRRYPVERQKMQREMITVKTRWGEVRAKQGTHKDQVKLATPEYEDCARIAREKGIALRQVYEEVRAILRTDSEQ